MENNFKYPVKDEKPATESVEKPEIYPDNDLIGKKLEICKFANPANFSFTNNYQMAKNLYAAIFFPKDTQAIAGMISQEDRFPDAFEILSQPISSAVQEVPTEEEFIEKIRHVVEKEVDYSACVIEGAKEILTDLLQKGRSNVIFTSGDHAGVAEHSLPGTKEQLYKIGSLGFFNAMRKQIAQESGRDRKDVLSVVASENKLELLPEVMESLVDKGVRVAIYIDDRLSNLEQAKEILANTQKDEIIELVPIWLRRGKYKNASNKNQDEIAEIDEIHDLSEMAGISERNGAIKNALANNEAGFIIDLDEVILDGKKQKKVQLDAIIQALKNKGWI